MALRVVACLLVVGLLDSAWGADVGITGAKLHIRARGTTSKLTFVSKDPLAPFPPLGSADDPATGTPGGVTIELLVPTAIRTLVVPAGVGAPGWRTRDGTLDAYTYKNASAPAGPSMVRSVTLRQSRVLKIQAKSVPLALTTQLGSVGIRVTMGSTRTCAFFDITTIVRDLAGTFSARNAVVRPVDCDDASLGQPPACGNGTVDPGEQCDGTTFLPGDACGGDIPGQAQRLPGCQGCCALQICSASLFDAPCCPGFACPPRIGPNSISVCSQTCQTSDECDAGDFCLAGICRTPTCSSDAQCGPYGVCFGVCCFLHPTRGFICG